MKPYALTRNSWIVVGLIAGALMRFAGLATIVNAAIPSATTQTGEMTPKRPQPSTDARRLAVRQRIDRFLAHVQKSTDFGPSSKRAVADAWQQHRDDAQLEPFLTAGLAMLSEPFKIALDAIEKEDYAQAERSLRTLIESQDLYVSLHASALLARSLVAQEKIEEAEAILHPLAARSQELADNTFLHAEVDFLLGYCQLLNLRYDDAMASFDRFRRNHAKSPDRLLQLAEQLQKTLAVRQPEGLRDVSDLMTYSARRLGHRKTGKPVQQKQLRTVKLLTKLIAEAQRQEQEQQNRSCKQCGGKGCKQCRRKNAGTPLMPSTPMQESQLPGGEGRIGDLQRSQRASPGEQWGNMRPEQREKILQSLRKNFPSRYRQLVEQYYKQLAKER